MNEKAMNLFSLAGRTALVTGSSRGIGRAIALGLAACGADVIFNYASQVEAAEQAAAEAAAFGVRSCALQGDMADDDGPHDLFAAAVERLGRIDILVLNVSTQFRRRWSEVTNDEFELQMRVNLRSAMNLMQLALPGMSERRWGRILTIGSVQQARPHPEMLVYAASKCAQLSMVRSLARQVAKDGITINNLAPGVIQTDRNSEPLSDPAYRDRVLAAIPAGILGEPEDCVGAALLLCSEAGRYITGADLFVDGGMAL